MSMCLALVTIGDANLRRVLADPPLVLRVIDPNDDEGYRIARRNASQPSLWKRLFGGGGKADAPAEPPADLTLRPGEGHTIDVDKAWHGLHYLLTGSTDGGEHPHNFLLLGGKEVGDVDVGYGPARAFTPTETREIHTALAALSDDALRARFNPKEMMAEHVYPEIWDRDPKDDDTLDYLMCYLPALRKFLDDTVRQQLGMLIYLS